VADPAWFGLIDFKVLLLEKLENGVARPVPVLPERARSECARSTAAVGTSHATL